MDLSGGELVRIRSHVNPAVVGLVVLLGTLAGMAQEGETGISLVHPDRTDLLSGRAMLRAEVHGPVREVEFWVDGALLAVDSAPPFEALWLQIDNDRDHLIRAVAVRPDEQRAYDLLSLAQLGPVTRVSVTGHPDELVLLRVTFLDAKGQPITDVRPEEVQIQEDGRKRTLEIFSPDTRPLAVQLLLDASSSTYSHWPQLARSTGLFAETLRSGDVAGVEAFTHMSFNLAPLGSSVEEIRAATTRFDSWGGGTLLYDVLSRTALYTLGREKAPRKAVLVLTDGDDSGSALDADDAREYLRRGEVEVHAILLSRENVTSIGTQRKYSEVAHYHRVLARIAEATGGSRYEVGGLPLEEIFVRIGERLRSQYVAGFYSLGKRATGEERDVRVILDRKGRHRTLVREGHFGGQSLGEYLAREIGKGSAELRVVAIRAASLNREPVALEAMVAALTQGKTLDEGVAVEARFALMDLGPVAVPYLDAAVDSGAKKLPSRAATVLADLLIVLHRAGRQDSLQQSLQMLEVGDRTISDALRRLEGLDLPEATRAGLQELYAAAETP
jgi:VWFA-related protein